MNPEISMAIFSFKIALDSQVPVAHAYNPSYSGGRHQENHSSKPVWANNP
jgi:hypothetical protein